MGRINKFAHLHQAVASGLAAAAVLAMLCHMVPARGPGDTNAWRQPHWYDPTHESTYAFNTYVQDIQLWLMMTETSRQPQS